MPGFNSFSGLPPMFAFAGPNPFGRISFEQQHNAFGDFSRVLDSWASACQAMAAPVIEHSGATPDNPHGSREIQAPRDGSGTAGDGIGENLQAIVAFHSDAGMAVARAFFPDHTVVKLELPMPNFRFEPDSNKAPSLKDDQ